MSGIWLCDFFHGRRCTASLERNKRLRWTEALYLTGKEEDERQEEIRYSCRPTTLKRFHTMSTYNLSFYLAPKEPEPVAEPVAAPVAAPKEPEEKSKGFKKKNLKSRLIIRNLSFKVPYATCS